ncbi:MAG: peptidoglycan-associated lipoprotein Pal [Betaproteobacteria bacterium]
MNKLMFAAIAAAFLGACSTAPQVNAPVDDKSVGATTGSTGGANTSGGAGTGVSGSNVAGGNPLRDPNNVLSKRSVYFDFDSFVVRDEFKPLIEAHARYLAGNRSAHTTIQGNTDERGSREYNIALGQRRADAAKRLMTLQGAQESQIETVSFGKEKPRNPGNDEAAYAENRRDDIVYQGE